MTKHDQTTSTKNTLKDPKVSPSFPHGVGAPVLGTAWGPHFRHSPAARAAPAPKVYDSSPLEDRSQLSIKFYLCLSIGVCVGPFVSRLAMETRSETWHPPRSRAETKKTMWDQFGDPGPKEKI